MAEQKWTSFKSFNARTEENYQKHRSLQLERRQASRRKLTASLRQRNKLVALDMALIGVLGIGIGVLLRCVV